MRVDYRCDGIGGVVKSVDEFEGQSNQQSAAEQNVRPRGAKDHVAHVTSDAGADEEKATEQNQDKDDGARAAGPTTHFLVECTRSCGRCRGRHKNPFTHGRRVFPLTIILEGDLLYVGIVTEI